MSKGYLVLQDGQIFTGERFGALHDAVGELVFTTGMAGYIETLTDPSYYGQIIMQTFPLIGNYGWISADAESGSCAARAYVVREWCHEPSNFRCEKTLDAYLKEHNVAGLSGVNTRALTRIIREHGVMNAAITSDPASVDLTALAAYTVADAVESVTVKEAYTVAAETEKHRVVLIDYGVKGNIVRELTRRGCTVTVVPASATAAEILSLDPDGIMLSNGPGDPQENTACIATLRELLGKKPIFGICLGHQLLALAQGGMTVKLPFGHRGANQPVRDLVTGRTYITSQNHGYAVLARSIPPEVGQERFQNANDGTCEGMDYPSARAFTVQFHPEACAGPWDAEFLFDRFVAMMEG
jgi:carbamoyl-phosphate synthase small subunit